MKQGGSTGNANSTKGMRHESRCSICGRSYAMAQQKNRHEKQCKEYNAGYCQRGVK